MTRLAALFLLAATPALALDPAACTVDNHHPDYGRLPLEELLPQPDEQGDVFVRHQVGPVIDLGEGMVATPHLTEHVGRMAEGIWFDHCPTGTGFRIAVRERDGDREADLLDQDPYAVVLAAMASDQAYTMADIARLLGHGQPYDVSMEVCGCGAFYPEMRGDRFPFEPNGINH